LNNKKIFGIGLSRTGTTSLTRALEMLGYKASHWEDHDTINQHIIQNQFELPLLKHYDALVDNPIPSIYQELDQAYPGSKFILTTRDYESWIKSVKQHHLVNVGPDNPSFNTALCFGTWYFDEKKFKRKYEEHEEEVKNYFKGRKEDLLIIDICTGEGWEKLCPFLEKAKPKRPFPHKNQMDYNKKEGPAFHPEGHLKNRKPLTNTHSQELEEQKAANQKLENKLNSLQQELNGIYASISWRLIQFLLSPLRLLKK